MSTHVKLTTQLSLQLGMLMRLEKKFLDIDIENCISRRLPDRVEL